MAYTSRRLAHQVAIVAGAGRGICRAIGVAHHLADPQDDVRPSHRSGRSRERADRHGGPARCPRARPRRLLPPCSRLRLHGSGFAIVEARAAMHAKAGSALPEFPDIAVRRRAVPGPAGAPDVLD
jgi:hypothetical protein